MKIMVIHPGTQHSTKLVAAIKSHGHEVKLVTTVYNKKGSLINKLFKILPNAERQRINSRKHSDLTEEDIILFNELKGLILLVIGRLDKKKILYTWYKRIVAKKVGIRAAKMAVKENYDLVFSFDSYAEYPFSYLKNKNSKILCIMDCSAAYAEAAKITYSKQIELYPQLKEALMEERCVLWNKKYYSDMLHEAKISDYIICASSYTKRTLTEYGIKNDVITVIPYGYNPASVCKSEDKREGFNILYVGGVNIMKGMPYLIEAFKSIKNDTIKLTLVGNVQSVIRDMCKDDSRISLKGYIPHKMIHQEYAKADLFVFPSLSDGFGFAPLEAMSYGVVCAVSDASGICDVILDGENGFIFKAESSIEIKRIIEKCIDDKHMLNVMSKKARIKALEFSEKSYADKIESFLEKIEI